MKRFVLSIALGAFVLATAAAPAAPGDRRYTHPGRLVRAGSVTLNLVCEGRGTPTVVFDAGWEDWAPSWALVQPAITAHTRACSYDRAGAGFSSPGRMPRTSVEIARELHAALHAAGIPGPYLLVGHSFGSYNTRAFADLYMPEVYGLVLVDGEDGDVTSPKERAADDRHFASIVGELRACRDALAAGRPLPMLPPSPLGAATCNQQFFRGLPERAFSPALNAALLHITRTKLALYDEVISEMTEMPYDAQWLIAHRRLFGNRPVRVLTAQNHTYDTARTPPAVHRKHLASEHELARDQAHWLSLSTNSRQIYAYRSGHYIQLDQPYIVIDAVLDELRFAGSRT